MQSIPRESASTFAGLRSITCALCWWFVSCGVSHAVLPKTISVRIFVDEEEPRITSYWQETLAKRLDQASVILSRYGSVRFSVTKFSTWDSDDRLTRFAESLKEFELEAKPEPAELSIGFTSQYQLKRGRSNLGGTRGPLRKHILIREGAPNVQEVERLEVLIHELAHYLGAAHSGNPGSVMRPVLGDGRSRARSFQIVLDEPNAQIVRLVTEEMASRNVKSMYQLTIPAQIEVRKQYLTLAQQFPEDKVAGAYAGVMERSIRRAVQRRQQIQEARAKARQAAKAKADTTKKADLSSSG